MRTDSVYSFSFKLPIMKEGLAKKYKIVILDFTWKSLIYQFFRINISDLGTFPLWKQKSLILQNKDFCFQSMNVSGPDWLIRINWLIHHFYVKSRLKCKDIIFKLTLANMAANFAWPLTAVHKIPIMGFGGYQRVSKMTVNRIRLRFWKRVSEIDRIWTSAYYINTE